MPFILRIWACCAANLPAEPDSNSTQAVSEEPLGFTRGHDSGPTTSQQNHNFELSEAGLDLKLDCSAAGTSCTEASARAMLPSGAAATVADVGSSWQGVVAHVDCRSATPRGAHAHPTHEGSAHGFNCHSSIPLALDLLTTYMASSTAYVLGRGSETGSPTRGPEPQVTQTHASESRCTLRAASGPTALSGSEAHPNMSDSPSQPQAATGAADTHNCDARVSGYHQPQVQLSPLDSSDLLYRLGALGDGVHQPDGHPLAHSNSMLQALMTTTFLLHTGTLESGGNPPATSNSAPLSTATSLAGSIAHGGFIHSTTNPLHHESNWRSSGMDFMEIMKMGTQAYGIHTTMAPPASSLFHQAACLGGGAGSPHWSDSRHTHNMCGQEAHTASRSHSNHSVHSFANGGASQTNMARKVLHVYRGKSGWCGRCAKARSFDTPPSLPPPHSSLPDSCEPVLWQPLSPILSHTPSAATLCALPQIAQDLAATDSLLAESAARYPSACRDQESPPSSRWWALHLRGNMRPTRYPSPSLPVSRTLSRLSNRSATSSKAHSTASSFETSQPWGPVLSPGCYAGTSSCMGDARIGGCGANLVSTRYSAGVGSAVAGTRMRGRHAVHAGSVSASGAAIFTHNRAGQFVPPSDLAHGQGQGVGSLIVGPVQPECRIFRTSLMSVAAAATRIRVARTKSMSLPSSGDGLLPNVHGGMCVGCGRAIGDADDMPVITSHLPTHTGLEGVKQDGLFWQRQPAVRCNAAVDPQTILSEPSCPDLSFSSSQVVGRPPHLPCHQAPPPATLGAASRASTAASGSAAKSTKGEVYGASPVNDGRHDADTCFVEAWLNSAGVVIQEGGAGLTLENNPPHSIREAGTSHMTQPKPPSTGSACVSADLTATDQPPPAPAALSSEGGGPLDPLDPLHPPPKVPGSSDQHATPFPLYTHTCAADLFSDTAHLHLQQQQQVVHTAGSGADDEAGLGVTSWLGVVPGPPGCTQNGQEGGGGCDDGGGGWALDPAAQVIEDLTGMEAGGGLAGHGGDQDSVVELASSHPVGRGDFGKVYKGTWRGRRVAVKVIPVAQPPASYAALLQQRSSASAEGVGPHTSNTFLDPQPPRAQMSARMPHAPQMQPLPQSTATTATTTSSRPLVHVEAEAALGLSLRHPAVCATLSAFVVVQHCSSGQLTLPTPGGSGASPDSRRRLAKKGPPSAFTANDLTLLGSLDDWDDVPSDSVSTHPISCVSFARSSQCYTGGVRESDGSGVMSPHRPSLRVGLSPTTSAGSGRGLPARQPLASMATGASAEAYLIMQFCNKGSLRSLLDARKIRPHRFSEVLPLAWDVCCAVEYLHANQVVHGDLKAANVMVCKLNEPEAAMMGRRLCARVADFGSSKLMGEATASCLTLSWPAPTSTVESCMWAPTSASCSSREPASSNAPGSPTPSCLGLSHMSSCLEPGSSGTSGFGARPAPANNMATSTSTRAPAFHTRSHTPRAMQTAPLNGGLSLVSEHEILEYEPSAPGGQSLLHASFGSAFTGGSQSNPLEKTTYHNPADGPRSCTAPATLEELTTLSHLDPELVTGAAAEHSFSSDVYALGVTLWEMATGQRPYHRMKAADLLQLKQRPTADVLTFSPEVLSYLPEDYTALCRDCWRPANDRPSAASAVARLAAMAARLSPPVVLRLAQLEADTPPAAVPSTPLPTSYLSRLGSRPCSAGGSTELMKLRMPDGVEVPDFMNDGALSPPNSLTTPGYPGTHPFLLFSSSYPLGESPPSSGPLTSASGIVPRAGICPVIAPNKGLLSTTEVSSVRSSMAFLAMPASHDHGPSSGGTSTPGVSSQGSKANMPMHHVVPLGMVVAGPHRLAQISHPSTPASTPFPSLDCAHGSAHRTQAQGIKAQQAQGITRGSSTCMTDVAAADQYFLPLPELPPSYLQTPHTCIVPPMPDRSAPHTFNPPRPLHLRAGSSTPPSSLTHHSRYQRTGSMPQLLHPQAPHLLHCRSISGSRPPTSSVATLGMLFMHQASLPSTPRQGSSCNLAGVVTPVPPPLAHMRGRSFRLPHGSPLRCLSRHMLNQQLAVAGSQLQAATATLSHNFQEFQTASSHQAEHITIQHEAGLSQGRGSYGGDDPNTAHSKEGSCHGGVGSGIPLSNGALQVTLPPQLPLATLSVPNRVGLLLAYGLPQYAMFEGGMSDAEILKSLSVLPELG